MADSLDVLTDLLRDMTSLLRVSIEASVARKA